MLCRTLILLVFAGLATGCRDSGQTVASGDEPLIWVSSTISGGRQCAPREEFEVPDTRELLAAVGIEAVRTEIEELGVCMACECPVYAGRHFALIREADRQRAAEAGFEPSGAPPEAPGT